MRGRPAAVLLAVLPATAPAQQQEAAPPPEVLEVRARTSAIHAFLERIPGVTTEVPEGKWLHLEVAADGTVEHRLADTGPEELILEVHARPAAGWDLVEFEKAGVLGGMARGLFVIGLAAQNIPTRDAILAWNSLLDAPRMVDELTVEARGDFESGIDVAIGMVPVAGTWLAQVVERMRPIEKHPPELRDPDAIGSLRVAFDPAALPVMARPFQELALTGIYHDAEQRTARLATLDALLSHWDGTAAWSVESNSGRTLRLLGLKDPDAYRDFLDGEDWQQMEEEMTERLRLVQWEDRHDHTLRHRGVTLEASTWRLDTSGLPVAVGVGSDAGSGPIGDSRVLQGTVGSHELTFTLAAHLRAGDPEVRENATALIDRILDGRLPAPPLPDEGLAVLELRPRAIAARMAEALGKEDLPGGPFPVRCLAVVKKQGDGLGVSVRIE